MKKQVTEVNALPYLLLFIGFPIALLFFLKWQQKKDEERLKAEHEAEREKSENEQPNFFLEDADAISKIVTFNFGKENREYQSQIDKKEVFFFKKFKLVVQDVYENGDFKEISFKLFKKNELNEFHFFEKIQPKIDYALW